MGTLHQVPYHLRNRELRKGKRVGVGRIKSLHTSLTVAVKRCYRAALLNPQLIATIDYLERTGAKHLRHSVFAGLSKKWAL